MATVLPEYAPRTAEENSITALAEKFPSVKSALDLAVAFECMVAASRVNGAVAHLAYMLSFGTALNDEGVENDLKRYLAGLSEIYAHRLARDDFENGRNTAPAPAPKPELPAIPDPPKGTIQ
jgi:hypothetical protein